MQKNKLAEKITQVRSKINGDLYYTSNFYEKNIDGVPFVGVFLRLDDRKHVNWMRADKLDVIGKVKP